MRIGGLLTGVAMTLLLVACATAPKAPAVVPALLPPRAPVEAAPPLPSPAAPAGWEDMALTPGDWRFAAAPAEAAYGEGGAAAFTVRCDAAQRRVLLVRPDAAGSSLTIRTTFGGRQLLAGEGGTAALPASDAFLDGLISSRGRFAVETPGRPALILPTWPEPARVIEECRP